MWFLVRLLLEAFRDDKDATAFLRFPACISLKFLRLQISKADFPFLEEIQVKWTPWECDHDPFATFHHLTFHSDKQNANICKRLRQREGKTSAASAMTASEKRLSDPCLCTNDIGCIKHHAETCTNVLKHVASLCQWLRMLCHAILDRESPTCHLEINSGPNFVGRPFFTGMYQLINHNYHRVSQCLGSLPKLLKVGVKIQQKAKSWAFSCFDMFWWVLQMLEPLLPGIRYATKRPG